MEVRLSDLVKVSNNSILTRDVHKTISEKLTPIEQRDFMRWLQLIENQS
jgi:hypothetical protein